MNRDDLSLNQDELDRYVSERIEWASRFAAAAAHDLGNLMLAMRIVQPATRSGTEAPDADSSQYLQTIIDGLRIWQQQQPSAARRCTVRNWWMQNGQMIRHFLPRSARWSMHDRTGDALVPADVLSIALASMLTGFARQVQAIERVALTLELDQSTPHIGVRIDMTPAPGSIDLLVPTLARQWLRTDGHDTGDLIRRTELGVELRLPAPPLSGAGQPVHRIESADAG